MKKAIISVNNCHFDVDAILALNNAQRIEWYNDLVEANCTIHNQDLCMVFLTVEDFINEVNSCGHCFDFKLVAIDYTEIKDGKMVFNKHEFYDMTIRFCAKTHEAERTKEEYQDMANDIYNVASAKFGTDVDVNIHGYYNDVTDYRFDIYVSGDKCRILNNIPPFCTEVGDIKGFDFCEAEWSMDGNDINQMTYERYDDKWLLKSKKSQLITPINKEEYEQEQLDKAIERANGELAECIQMVHNCKNLQEVYRLVDKADNDMSFGNDNYSDKDYIGICYKSIQFDVLSQSDGGIMISGDKVQVFNDEGHEIWTGRLEEIGVKGVESQDDANIYLKPDEPEQSQVTNDDDLDLSEYCPMNYDGESCFMLENGSHRNFYLSVFVDKSFDQFSWKLYDEDYKMIDSDWQCGMFESSWMELFYPDSTGIGEHTGNVTFICNLSPKVFHHLLQS